MKKHYLFLFALVIGFGFAKSANAQTATKVVNGKTYIVHKVLVGETLYKISKTYNVSVADIQSANSNSATIKAGEELLVPANTGESKNSDANPETVEHTVVQGETLSKIARDFSTTAAELLRINKLSNENIKVGQVIKVPAPADALAENPSNVIKDQKPAQAQKAEPEKAPKPKPVVKADVNPGMPATAEVVLTETATEKEDTGNAKIYEHGMDQSRTFVMHPFLPKGSIIVVINEVTGKMAYCRVVDNIRSTELGGANLAITKAVADKIGLVGTEGKVKIKYGTP